jgi:monoamine oxidase
MNKRVTEINYQQSITNITTASGEIYKCEKVISSLPLGVLKKNVVKFVPELPDKYKIAIDTIGNGRADKLFVTFAEPFWDLHKKWINFYT